MCGISGIINKDFGIDRRESIMQTMLNKIQHRGPDGSSSWSDSVITLGHNRLKIIDLSDNSKQPMHKDEFVITYNGEIYNYIELKQTLSKYGYEFTSMSDTEVILYAYMHWGAACVQEFVGMWSFAIWNKKNKTLFCSRDRFGIKPFYYIYKNNAFYFSSEIKALLETPDFNNKLNQEQVKRGMLMGWVSYEDESIYEDIKILPPSSNIVISENKFSINKYWDIKRTENSKLSDNEKKLQFYEMFKETLKIHLRCDVAYGGCLSGGLDSSSIASVISQDLEKEFKTFSIYYNGASGLDERPFIYEVTDKYKSIKPHYFTPTDEQIADAFDTALYHNDLPFTDSSYLSQYFVMKLAADNDIKVLVDGQGADEYLAGYFHSFYRAIAQKIRNFNLIDAYSIFNGHAGRQNFNIKERSSVLMKTALSSVFSEHSLYAIEYKVKANNFLNKEHRKTTPFKLNTFDKDKFHSFLYNLLFYTSLPSLLHYVDRNSMTFSIESRVPYLDHRLVEFVFSLSQNDKISLNGETKHINREALSKVLPEKISSRTDKKGFVTPGATQWMRGSLKHLLNINFERFSMLDKNNINSMIKSYLNGDNKNAKLLWNVAVYNYWLEKNNLSA